MTDRERKFLQDILVSIHSIEEFLGPKKNFEAYLANKMLRRAVERELEIIGEALNQLDKSAPELKIGSKRQIIGMRNRVIHGYDSIDDKIVWGTLIRHLPELKREVEALLLA
jgi:uncharacterized protein with HEPN domain